MFWFTALLASTLGAAPASADRPGQVVVLVSRRSALTAQQGLAVADQVSAALREAGLPVGLSSTEATARLAALGVPDVAACEGQVPCVASHAARLGAGVVVALEVGQVLDDVAARALAVRVADGQTVGACDTAGAATEVTALLARAVVAMAPAIRGALPEAPRPPVDAPRVVELAPRAASPSTVVSSTTARWSKPTVWVAGGTAIAAGLAGAAFGVRGLAARDAYEAVVDRSSGAAAFDVSQGRAEQLRGLANDSFAAAAGAGAVSAVLAVVTGYLVASAGEP